MRSQKKNLQFFLLFLIFVGSAYSLNYDASWHFDDYPNIVENPRIHITNIRLNNLKEALLGGYDKGQYLGKNLFRPVPMLSFALNWYIGKDNVFGYHIVNNAIHLVTTCFLFLTVLNLFDVTESKGKIPRG